MATPEHLAKLKQGVVIWNEWRDNNPRITPDLSDSDLSFADLEGAILDQVLLNGSRLFRAYCIEANIMNAALSGADLTEANYSIADLKYADLRNVVLAGTNFNGSAMRACNLDGALLLCTSFSGVDLSEVIGLGSVIHEGESSIGVDTISYTLRNSGGRFTDEQNVFFKGAGVPPLLLEYLPSIFETDPIQFYSCFISYNTENEEFANSLNDDLNGSGIKTWKWNLDSLPGRTIEANIDVAMRNYDKMILVCSVNSLTSRPVEREIQRAMEKEDRLRRAKAGAIKRARKAGDPPPNIDTDVLVPIMVDDYVLEWESELAPEVRRYYIPNFTFLERGSADYKRELDKLINALNPKSWPPNA